MVKIPSLDELKKAGTGFMDQARTSGISGVVDKIKSGIDAVGIKTDGIPVAPGDNALKNQIQAVQAVLAEVTQAQAIQAAAIRKLDSQLAALSKAIDASIPVVTPSNNTTATVMKDEDKKSL